MVLVTEQQGLRPQQHLVAVNNPLTDPAVHHLHQLSAITSPTQALVKSPQMAQKQLSQPQSLQAKAQPQQMPLVIKKQDLSPYKPSSPNLDRKSGSKLAFVGYIFCLLGHCNMLSFYLTYH